LPVPQREVVLPRFVDDLTLQQLAELLEVRWAR
jgi:DNA-directed RNA polymerase specialized sigma24 family protein